MRRVHVRALLKAAVIAQIVFAVVESQVSIGSVIKVSARQVDALEKTAKLLYTAGPLDTLRGHFME